jgi:hypothetical protein
LLSAGGSGLLAARAAVTASGFKSGLNLSSDAATINRAEKFLQRNLSPEEKRELIRIHHIGEGQVGADGSQAGLNNYTIQQKMRKGLGLMRNMRLSRNQAEMLMDNNVVGMVARPSVIPPEALRGKYFDFGKALKIDGLSDMQTKKLNALIDQNVKRGQEGAFNYFRLGHFLSDQRYDINDVIKKVFPNAPVNRLSFKQGIHPITGKPSDQFQIFDPQAPSSGEISIDPAAGYAKVILGGRVVRVVRNANDDIFLMNASSNTEMHFQFTTEADLVSAGQ